MRAVCAGGRLNVVKSHGTGGPARRVIASAPARGNPTGRAAARPRGLPVRDAVGLARDLIARAGVATVPGTDFGAPRTLRLSLCSGRFEEGIDRLAEYFAAAPAPPAGPSRRGASASGSRAVL